jgi:hypothetical protein
VTLLTTFPCKDATGNDAFIVCADAQETLGDYRFFLDKLEPRRTGNFEIVIGGAGYSDLVEAFELRITSTLTASQATTIGEFEAVVQSELLDYVKNEVAAFLRKKDARIRFVIGARAIQTNKCGCWITKASRLKRVTSFELLGVDEPIYRHLAKRLYSDNLTIGQALRACLYLLSIAKATSTAVGGQPSLAILCDYKLNMESLEYIREAEEHLQELTAANDKVSVALPDIGMAAIEFEATLQEFVREAWVIRKKYVTMAAARIVLDIQQGKGTLFDRFKFPEGTGIGVNVVDGELTVYDDPHKGLWVGSFRGNELDQNRTASRLRLCGKRREFGGQVFVEVVPCKLPQNTQHKPNENCISGKWLETLSASDIEDDPVDIQSME